MFSNKKAANYLAEICHYYGVENAVISPGSRNAPLIHSFNSHTGIQCHSLIDERSAGFFALGMSNQSQKPVVLICTSGTALLNYAPALSEALHQKVPLIAISADRPEKWIGKGVGQTIDQRNAFGKQVRSFLQLPPKNTIESDPENLIQTISETIHSALHPIKGPVHINVPFDEPLYQTLSNYQPGRLNLSKPAFQFENNSLDYPGLSGQLSGKKIMVVCGFAVPNPELNSQLAEFAHNYNAVVLTETASNLHSKEFIPFIDRAIIPIEGQEKAFFPDLLITLGGTLISKKIKALFRKNKPKDHWHIGIEDQSMDTFESLNFSIQHSPSDFFTSLNLIVSKPGNREYKDHWIKHIEKVESRHNIAVDNIPFSDLKLFSIISSNLETATILHLSNSSPIRYAQLFDWHTGIPHYCNRGTSGIDGCTSTAVGFSVLSGKTNLLITGDIAFLYDSNALLNHTVPGNLKIIYINNGGGNIFRIIEGPTESPDFVEFYETHHNFKLIHLCNFFNVGYLQAGDETTFKSGFNELMNSPGCTVLEVITPRMENDKILKSYFKNLRYE